MKQVAGSIWHHRGDQGRDQCTERPRDECDMDASPLNRNRSPAIEGSGDSDGQLAKIETHVEIHFISTKNDSSFFSA
jgi:hypothetical protein